MRNMISEVCSSPTTMPEPEHACAMGVDFNIARSRALLGIDAIDTDIEETVTINGTGNSQREITATGNKVDIKKTDSKNNTKKIITINGKGNSQSPTIATALVAKNKNTPIDRLNYDVFVLIAKELGVCQSTCLGLTCRKLYQLLKEFYPEPIRLDSLIKDEMDPYFSYSNRLAHMLQKWMGPDYWLDLWLAHPGQLVFLKKSVYPENCSTYWGIRRHPKTQMLWERYFDWSDMDSARKKGSVPSPYGLGDTWYDLALAYIKEEVKTSSNLFRTISYWQSFFIYESRKGEMDQIFEEAE